MVAAATPPAFFEQFLNNELLSMLVMLAIGMLGSYPSAFLIAPDSDAQRFRKIVADIRQRVLKPFPRQGAARAQRLDTAQKPNDRGRPAAVAPRDGHPAEPRVPAQLTGRLR